MIRLLIVVVLLVTTLYSGFLIGANFNQTKSLPQPEKIPSQDFVPPIQPYGLTCFTPELPNSSAQDRYQFNCVSPVTSEQMRFVFKDQQLSCQVLSSQIYSLSGGHWKPSQTDMVPMPISESPYNLITTIKGSTKFFVKFDYVNNELDSSEDLNYSARQPYVIIQNDSRIINAIRKTKTDDPTLGFEYEYLTLSKQTGKGVHTFSRATDKATLGVVFEANFFQCQ